MSYRMGSTNYLYPKTLHTPIRVNVSSISTILMYNGHRYLSSNDYNCQS